ncbi:MAG: phosphatidate cytidylyltransferase [Clostridium sp.]|nr:phosphatidate cytidylyltransferase [Clostridium sp.]
MSPKIQNLFTRTATGIVFTAAVIGSFYYGPLTFALFFGLVTLLSVREFCQIVRAQDGIQPNTFICAVAGLYLFLAFWAYMGGMVGGGIFIPYLLTLLYLLVSELYLNRPSPLGNWAYTMMSQLYVALPFAVLNALAFQRADHSSLGVEYRYLIPLSVFFFLWASDTGAYCFGSLLGKRKLFPRISPNKSWEGSVGGGITAIALSQLLATFDTVSLGRIEWAGLALTVVVFGTWGDLVESLIKRKLGIKDSGNILPGHGGMLDRFDSSLLAIPAALIYIYTLQMAA